MAETPGLVDYEDTCKLSTVGTPFGEGLLIGSWDHVVFGSWFFRSFFWGVCNLNLCQRKSTKKRVKARELDKFPGMSRYVKKISAVSFHYLQNS